MKIIDSPQNLERIMDRIQCNRDLNLNFMGLIQEISFKSIYCCHSDGLAISPEGDFDFLSITIGGEAGIITIDP